MAAPGARKSTPLGLAARPLRRRHCRHPADLCRRRGPRRAPQSAPAPGERRLRARNPGPGRAGRDARSGSRWSPGTVLGSRVPAPPPPQSSPVPSPPAIGLLRARMPCERRAPAAPWPAIAAGARAQSPEPSTGTGSGSGTAGPHPHNPAANHAPTPPGTAPAHLPEPHHAPTATQPSNRPAARPLNRPAVRPLNRPPPHRPRGEPPAHLRQFGPPPRLESHPSTPHAQFHPVPLSGPTPDCFQPRSHPARPAVSCPVRRPCAPDLRTRAPSTGRCPGRAPPCSRTASHQFLSESLTRLKPLRSLCQQALT